MLEWCSHAGVPAHVLLNKCDKLGRGPATATLHQVTATIAKQGWAASAQLFSALKQDGTEQAWQVLATWLQLE